MPTGSLHRFAGSTAVVTGAGSGIGRAIALQLASEGVDIVAVDLRDDLVEDTAEAVRGRGAKALAAPADVSSREAMLGVADDVRDRLGVPAIVVASAGVSPQPLRPIWEYSPEDWAWVMSVNFGGVLHTVSAFLEDMLATDGPRHIVTINSMSQFRGIGGLAAYVTSKRAAEGYAECLAIEVEPLGIGVTIAYPGRVRTRLADSESLRPEGERSAARSLTALELPSASLVSNPEIEPELAAARILGAVAVGRRYVTTHAPPHEVMLGRLSQILDRPVVAA